MLSKTIDGRSNSSILTRPPTFVKCIFAGFCQPAFAGYAGPLSFDMAGTVQDVGEVGSAVPEDDRVVIVEADGSMAGAVNGGATAEHPGGKGRRGSPGARAALLEAAASVHDPNGGCGGQQRRQQEGRSTGLVDIVAGADAGLPPVPSCWYGT